MLDEFTNLRGDTFNYLTELDLSKLHQTSRMNFLKSNLILEIMTKTCCFPVKSDGVLQIPLAELGNKSSLLNFYVFPNSNNKVEVNIITNSL